MERMTGVIFSDLGLASSFMALDWVQLALKRSLGFAPFPATLNVRPNGTADAETWRRIRIEAPGLRLASAEGGYCSARLYPIGIYPRGDAAGEKIGGAILLPEVKDYPSDKIEIIAPVRLKDHLGVRDGDHLTWEFLH
jgi:CTP-dependent riboflavin kinase